MNSICRLHQNCSYFDYSMLMKSLYRITEEHNILCLHYLGNSLLDRSIPMVTLGKGKKHVLYVGTHHAMEWLTALLLTNFIEEYCLILKKGNTVNKLEPKEILNSYTLHILPMLNPDGVEYQIHGVEQANPLCQRLLAMNGQNADFRHWQANGRGVDLNHNYDAGFEEYKELERQNGIEGGSPTRYSGESPASEPETSALCNWLQFHRTQLSGVLTLHTQGEEIFYQSNEITLPRTTAIAQRISRLTGYTVQEAKGLASYSGLTDWCVQKLQLPSFTLECGKGVNPLPIEKANDIYAVLRNLLFTFPTFF